MSGRPVAKKKNTTAAERTAISHYPSSVKAPPGRCARTARRLLPPRAFSPMVGNISVARQHLFPALWLPFLPSPAVSSSNTAHGYVAWLCLSKRPIFATAPLESIPCISRLLCRYLRDCCAARQRDEDDDGTLPTVDYMPLPVMGNFPHGENNRVS